MHVGGRGVNGAALRAIYQALAAAICYVHEKPDPPGNFNERGATMTDPTQSPDPNQNPQQPGATPPPQFPPPYGGGWGPGGYPPLPPRPAKKPARVLPIILGLILLMGFGMMALLMAMSFFVSSGGGFGSAIGSKMRLNSSGIAMLRIEGPIMSGTYFDFWMKTLRGFAEDDKIKGVIIRIDSPGGSVGTSQELYDEILKLRKGGAGHKGKAVYVSMGNVAASGGYYIAAASDKIFASRGTLTGSIGVISTNIRVEGLAEKAGIQVEVIKSGRFKDAGSMFRPMTEAEQKVFDLLIGDAYGQFVDDILSQREGRIASALEKFPEEEWEKYQFEKPEVPNARQFLMQVADGRVYSGAQAHKLGLVDELGALNHVAARLAEDLGLGTSPDIYEPVLRQTLMDLLSSKVSDAVPSVLAHPTLQYRMIPF